MKNKPVLKASAVLLAVCATIGATSAQDLGDGVPSTIVSAPSIKPNPLGVGVGAAAAKSQEAPAQAAAPTAASADSERYPWLLPSDMHPTPLYFREATSLAPLYLDLPTPAEARLMLPGRAADALDRAKATVSKYLSDSMAAAAAGRGRQQETLDAWLQQTEQTRRKVPPDPWSAYEFYLEVNQELTKFKTKAEAQSKPALASMANDIRNAIPRIAEIMKAAPTYEVQTGWYGVMVQLKNGAQMYQRQVAAADAQLLRRIEEYSNTVNTVVVRPAGPVPKQAAIQQPSPGVSAQTSLEPSRIITNEKNAQAREKAKPVQVADTGSSTTGGLILVGGVLMLVGWVVLKLKRKKASAAPKA